jgi:hypothetical protein
MTKIAGSGSESGSISQRHVSADPDSHQNVMDPEHWYVQARYWYLIFAFCVPGGEEEPEGGE